MQIERNVVYAELKEGEIKNIPVQTSISFEEGNAERAFAQIEDKREALAKERDTNVAFVLLTTKEEKIVFVNDDYDSDLFPATEKEKKAAKTFL